MYAALLLAASLVPSNSDARAQMALASADADQRAQQALASCADQLRTIPEKKIDTNWYYDQEKSVNWRYNEKGQIEIQPVPRTRETHEIPEGTVHWDSQRRSYVAPPPSRTTNPPVRYRMSQPQMFEAPRYMQSTFVPMRSGGGSC